MEYCGSTKDQPLVMGYLKLLVFGPGSLGRQLPTARLAVFTYFTLLENPDAIYLLMAMPSLMFLFLTFQGCSWMGGSTGHFLAGFVIGCQPMLVVNHHVS